MVAHPRDETELERVLEWCDSKGHVVIPFGGGSSVVGGVTPPEADGVVTVDMDEFDRVVEIDATSRAARIQAGVFGPQLEDQLRAHGYTLRHYPQSFAGSTLGGWIATRSGGHYATNHTHIDDFVESIRMLTPSGAGGRAGGCPEAGQVLIQTAWRSAARASWESSRRRGCEFRPGPCTERRRA